MNPRGAAPYSRSTSQYAFPTGWFCDTARYANVMRHLEVLQTTIKYVGPGNSDQDAAAIRTDNPVPQDCPLYYFEVAIVNEGAKGLIGIGLSGKDVNLARLPGWDEHSFGYHGDDGNMFPGRGQGTLFGPTFTKDDVIGCYWNRAERVIGYTKNGIHLGVAFRDVNETVLYPTVGFRTHNEEVKANFGETQFVADLDAMWNDQCDRVVRSLNLTQIESSKSISSIVAELILDYLVHHRYWKAAAIVSSDLFEKKRLTEQDEASIVARQRIYEAVISGNIDEALSQTESIAAGTLEKHPRILFKLRCQKFMQMVQNPDEDSHSALQFGRTFLTPSCSSPEDHAFLSEVLTLIAYESPEQSPCGHLLKLDYKRELAEELNSAILENQGRKAKPPLETIYKQLFASIDELTKACDLDCQFVDFEKMLIGGLPSKE